MLIIKSNIIYSQDKDTLITLEDGFVAVNNNAVEFVGKELPEEYLKYEVLDYSDKLLIPGFADLHTHAPQFENIGLGMDKRLLQWLDDITFPTESKFKDIEYAKKMYANVVSNTIQSGTTRVCYFGTVHKDACQILIDEMKRQGIKGFVGKVNMDANCPDSLIEDTAQGLADTVDFYERNMDNSDVRPIITPRFAPSCTEETLKGLGELTQKYNAPVQSHINESLGEIGLVKELFPEYKNYADVYYQNNLLNDRTLMAHCIHMSDDDIKLFSRLGVWAVHCPQSNCNLASGIMPLKKLMANGIKIAFGTDVSGGNDMSIIKTIVSAMQMSRLLCAQNKGEERLTFAEAFYIATKGGGSYFGKVGSFGLGYEFDALIIDDSNISHKQNASLTERLEQFVFAGDDRNIVKRYIAGKEV